MHVSKVLKRCPQIIGNINSRMRSLKQFLHSTFLLRRKKWLVLTLALHFGWPIRQLNINDVFFQVQLENDMYMSQPPRFLDHAYATHVCKLYKAIYGIHQASHTLVYKITIFFLIKAFKIPSLTFFFH